MYARPSDLNDALGLLAEGDARVMAGATDIFPGAGESPLQGNYVDVTNIAALRGVRLQGGLRTPSRRGPRPPPAASAGNPATSRASNRRPSFTESRIAR